jgi:Mannosyltransferase (PIG-V)
VESVSESIETFPSTDLAPVPLVRSRAAKRTLLRALTAALDKYRVAILVYLGTRGLLLLVAFANAALRHHNFTHELANWDGLWYRELANKGYPAHIAHAPSTLGFFPAYPLVMWVVAHAFSWLTVHSFLWSVTVAGIVVSGLGGLMAAVLVQKLATGWWGQASGRRAAAFFCVFPGSVVFSMVYAEGLMIPLAIGTILALERRRWLLAGVLAGLATATEPEALVLILVCATSAALAIRKGGWRRPESRRALVAPALSLTGVLAVGGYFWARTGTPFANLLAQRYGWHERTDPLALGHLVRSLANEISFAHFNHPTINLNLVAGVLGAILLLALLVLLFKARRKVSAAAIVWTLGISFLTVTAEYTPPNPRLLITAFPAILLVGRYVKGRAFAALFVGTGALLLAMSALTFIGPTLRP